jgi:hypothetical protein
LRLKKLLRVEQKATIIIGYIIWQQRNSINEIIAGCTPLIIFPRQ